MKSWMSILVLGMVSGIGLHSGGVFEPEDAERAAVEAAVTDYVQALYKAEPERIARAVHPALQKTGVYRRPDSKEYGVRSNMNFDQLKHLAGQWNKGGRRTDLKYKVEVFDVLDQTACAKLTADWGIDYMELLKCEGQWKILHVLWQSHPPKR